MKLAREIAEKVFPVQEFESMYQKDVRLGQLERCEEIIAAKLEPIREALSAIAGPCERLTSHRCIDEPERYEVGSYYSGDRVCDACVADRALKLFEEDHD